MRVMYQNVLDIWLTEGHLENYQTATGSDDLRTVRQFLERAIERLPRDD